MQTRASLTAWTVIFPQIPVLFFKLWCFHVHNVIKSKVPGSWATDLYVIWSQRGERSPHPKASPGLPPPSASSLVAMQDQSLHIQDWLCNRNPYVLSCPTLPKGSHSLKFSYLFHYNYFFARQAVEDLNSAFVLNQKTQPPLLEAKQQLKTRKAGWCQSPSFEKHRCKSGSCCRSGGFK